MQIIMSTAGKRGQGTSSHVDPELLKPNIESMFSNKYCVRYYLVGVGGALN